MRQGASLIPRENLFSAQFPPVKGPPGLTSPFLELIRSDAPWSVCCDVERQCFVNVTDSLHRDGCLIFPTEKERDRKGNLQFHSVTQLCTHLFNFTFIQVLEFNKDYYN